MKIKIKELLIMKIIIIINVDNKKNENFEKMEFVHNNENIENKKSDNTE